MSDITFSEEQQALVDKLIGDARVKAREKTKTELDTLAAKAKETADQAALEEKQEWQKIAKNRETRINELEPLEAQVKRYEDMATEMLKGAMESLGDGAKSAVDGLPEGMSSFDKLNWLGKNQSLFQGNTTAKVGTPIRKQGSEKREIAVGEICKFPLRL